MSVSILEVIILESLFYVSFYHETVIDIIPFSFPISLSWGSTAWEEFLPCRVDHHIHLQDKPAELILTPLTHLPKLYSTRGSQLPRAGLAELKKCLILIVLHVSRKKNGLKQRTSKYVIKSQAQGSPCVISAFGGGGEDERGGGAPVCSYLDNLSSLRRVAILDSIQSSTEFCDI